MDEQTQNQTTNDVTDEITAVPVIEDGNPASVLLNMESIIKNHDLRMVQLREELKKHSDMIQGILDNDDPYKAAMDKLKDVNKVKAQAKSNALKQPNAVQLVDKVKGIKTELKELQSAFSDYLKEYLRMSGISEIEGYDGELREIVYIAKLVKKGSL